MVVVSLDCTDSKPPLRQLPNGLENKPKGGWYA
jgi:hypothetical protein